jgi:hypothetical protein
MLSIPLSSFKALSDRLRGALEDIANTASASTLQDAVTEKFTQLNLFWPGFYNSLDPKVVSEVDD